MTLSLTIDVFFCGKARRAINDRPVLSENLRHVYADEYQFNSDSELDCRNIREIIDETFSEAGIPNDEYLITLI